MDILAKHYHEKWEKYESNLKNNTLGLKGYLNGKMKGYKLEISNKNKEVSLEIVIELDEGRPAYGIYYGCRMQKGSDISDILQDIKQYFFEHYWEMRNPGFSINDLGNVFLPDKGKVSENETYWPFWIRLEEKYDITEAIKAVETTLQILRQKGFE